MYPEKEEKEEKEEEIGIPLENINEFFKLPIYYNDKKIKTNSNIITELEINNTYEPSGNSINSYFFNISKDNLFSQKISEQMSDYFTTDTSFLQDNQSLLEKYEPIHINLPEHNYNNNYKHILDIWSELKNDIGFKEKYQYIDWEYFEFLNNSEQFLQIMSIYNLVSPIISLITPIIMLIIPFLIIKIKGIQLTTSEYIEILKTILKNNAIGRLFMNFSSVSTNERIYICISAFFYVFSIYQNILTCIRFNHNMCQIHQYLKEVRNYLHYTTSNMKHYLSYSEPLSSHREFNQRVVEKLYILEEFQENLDNLSEYNFNIKRWLK
jgi:hypothetical protein